MILPALALLACHRMLELPEGPGPMDNPLKGYAAFDQSAGLFGPVSMSFIYVSWRELEPIKGQYAFEAFERKRWNTKNAKGKRFVLRVYLDYPNRESGVPPWLVDEGVAIKPYDRGPKGHDGKGQSPDYENPTLRSGLVRLISAMGNRWNQDPRVGFIELGLLGHYGEWHTYPNRDLFASDETQRLVVDAFHSSFPNIQLMARYGNLPSVHRPWIGFHDDMFPEDTLDDQSWHFIPGLKAGGVDNNWKVAPVGGEMVPRQAEKWLGEGWAQTKRAVIQSHFTWIGGYGPALVDSGDPHFIARRNELISLLGYEFRWVSADLPETLSTSDRLRFTIAGVNQGVAPFYYPWQLRFALIRENDEIALQWNSFADIRQWLPGYFRLDTVAPRTVTPGTYRVGVGIIDPATNQPGVRFANRLSEAAGFTILGSVIVN